MSWLRRLPRRPERADDWVRSLIEPELRDLGEVNADFAGIVAPVGGTDLQTAGVTAQFLERADTYHAAYFQTEY